MLVWAACRCLDAFCSGTQPKLQSPHGSLGIARDHLRGMLIHIRSAFLLRHERLQTCLDEFVFRFNRHRNRHAASLPLFLQALRTKPHPCRILIKPESSA